MFIVLSTFLQVWKIVAGMRACEFGFRNQCGLAGSSKQKK